MLPLGRWHPHSLLSRRWPGKARPNILPVKLPGLVPLLGNTQPVHRVCLCVYTNIWICFLNKRLRVSQQRPRQCLPLASRSRGRYSARWQGCSVPSPPGAESSSQKHTALHTLRALTFASEGYESRWSQKGRRTRPWIRTVWGEESPQQRGSCQDSSQ